MFALSWLIIIRPVAIQLIRKVQNLLEYLLVFFVRQPFCSLHLQLEMSENPYTSGPITSKKTVPGIIVATGSIAWSLLKVIICRDAARILIRQYIWPLNTIIWSKRLGWSDLHILAWEMRTRSSREMIISLLREYWTRVVHHLRDVYNFRRRKYLETSETALIHLETILPAVMSRVINIINADADLWRGAQRLVSWQWGSYAGGPTHRDAHPTLMVSGTSCRNYCGYELQWTMVTLLFRCSAWLQLMFSTDDRPSLRYNCIDAAAFRSVTDISKQKSRLQLCT